MPSLYAPMSGVNTKQKSVWGLMSGVNTKMKNGYGLMSGVNTKVFSGIVEWTYVLSGDDYYADDATSDSYSLYVPFRSGGNSDLVKSAQVKFNFSSPIAITKIEYSIKVNTTHLYSWSVLCDDNVVTTGSKYMLYNTEDSYEYAYGATVQSIAFKVSMTGGAGTVSCNLYVTINGVRILLKGNGVINN